MDHSIAQGSEHGLQITGSVTAVIFQSEETGYTVLRLDTGAEKPITAIGTLPFLAPGEELSATGIWVSHPSYGEQFKIHTTDRRLPSTEQAVYDFFASGVIHGIGRVTARAIVEQFGASALTVISEHPEQLTNLKGVTPKRAREIGAEVQRQAALRLLIAFLSQHGLPAVLSIKLYQAFQDKALAMVREDPYLLADPMFGGDFHLADRLALSLGVSGDSPRRLQAACLFILEHNLQNGHCFIPQDKLTAATARILDVPPALTEDALDTLVSQGRIVVHTLRGISACYLDYVHEAEQTVADKIRSMSATVPDNTVDVESLLTHVEADTGLTYAPEQRAAVTAAARGNILLLTGAPGTGKTTAVRAILALFDRLSLRTVLAAPTGRAAKRMSDLTGRDAVTIHRLLGAGFAGDDPTVPFERDASNPLEADAVILDESSMVDILLAQALILALPSNCRLVLVGDADQLPSVGPGMVFSDMIRSAAVPVIRLTEIFRQARESGIIRNAHAIHQGQMPDLARRETDFFFLQRPGAMKTVDTVVDLVARRLPEKMQIDPQDIQVLCPFKRGEAGTINLNARLQEALNPPQKDKPERRFGDLVFRPLDKVMQIRNNYDILWEQTDGTRGTGIFNGDIGQITEIDPRAGTVTVSFDGKVVSYAPEQLGELEPAFAMTVHKSQGSEYRAVVFVASEGPPMLLSRTVLYTGVTRARELLIIVGEGGVISTMVGNVRQQKRYSGLKLRLAGESSEHLDLDS